VTAIPEYWIVDPERKTVTAVARHELDRTARDLLSWRWTGADEPPEIRLADVFIDAD
jgi:hypothetical protein